MRRLLIAAMLLVGSILACGPEPSDDRLALVTRMDQALNGSCQYSVLEKHRANGELMCVLDALRKRCSKIDDCYVYCIGNDVGVGIGGGCDHLCNYAAREEWSYPQEAQACYEQ